MAKLDDMDKQILEKLHEDGRATFNEIGNELGITGNTVRRRIDEMQENDIIEKFTVLTNPAALEYLTVTFGLTVETGLIEEIGETLASQDCVYKLWILSGTHNVIFDARFRDTSHFQDFVHDVLHDTSGITSYESSIVTRSVMDEGSVILPDADDASVAEESADRTV